MRYFPLFVITGLLALTGCQDRGEEEEVILPASTEEEAESTSRLSLQELRERIAGFAPDSVELEKQATDEVEKLFTFEYLVEDLPIADKAEQMQERLSGLGRERWECFHLEQIADNLRLFCKRRPRTYLRYIPRVF